VAGAEAAAGSGEHDGPHVRVGLGPVEQVVVEQLHLQRPGVVALWPVERQLPHTGVVIDKKDVAHGPFPRSPASSKRLISATSCVLFSRPEPWMSCK